VENEMQATAKDLRFHSKEILDAISRGEEVLITYRGKPHAKIVPINSGSTDKPIKNKLFGIWKDYEDVDEVYNYIREKRKGRF
jgi:prevent-host-death family protein